MPPEVRTIVIAAWTRGGLLPKAVIEQTVPQQQPKMQLLSASET